jgi:hypothetical protein
MRDLEASILKGKNIPVVTVFEFWIIHVGKNWYFQSTYWSLEIVNPVSFRWKSDWELRKKPACF